MDNSEAPEPQPVASERHLRLRYAGTCRRCGKRLIVGVEALYDSTTRTVRCLVCEAPNKVGTEVIDASGTAGKSAHLEYQRRHLARQARVKGLLGNILGNVVLAITDDPQSIRAWERGSIGEQKLAEAMASVPEIKLLHDRRVPGTKGNIDHIVVAPGGVFVVDAKLYKGLIQIRDVGGAFNADRRLYVGRRDCSKLADMGWQVKAVQRALDSLGLQPKPPVAGVVCFVDAEWPLLFPPEEYKGVQLAGNRTITKLVAGERILEPELIVRVHHALAIALPPK